MDIYFHNILTYHTISLRISYSKEYIILELNLEFDNFNNRILSVDKIMYNQNIFNYK